MSVWPEQRHHDHGFHDESAYVPSSEFVVHEGMTTEPRGRMNGAIVFVIAALGITMVGILYLIQTSHVAGLGYEVSRLERERMEKSLENQSLTYEISRFQALPYIERIALEEIGMQPVEGQIYLTVEPPPSEDLIVPEPEAGEGRSIVDRLWGALLGEASATNATPAESHP